MTSISECSQETVSALLKKIAKGDYKLDICHMGDSIQNVKVLEEREASASPTSVLFADIIKRNLLPMGEIGSCRIPSVLKITLDPKDINKLYNDEGVFESLKYEQKVYEKILQKCIANKYSPNFVGFLASGKCSWDNLTDSFLTKYRTLLSDVICRRQRPEKKERIEAETKCKDIFDKLVVSATEPGAVGNPKAVSLYILATEKKGQISLGQYISDLEEENGKNPFNARPAEKEKVMGEVLNIMFQICYNLKLLETFSVMHNDLHIGNLRIEVLGSPRTIYYEYNGMYFKIVTRHVVYFYDWDRAFESTILGDNPFYGTPFYMNHGNKFARGFDFQGLLGSIQLYHVDFYNLFLEPFDNLFSDSRKAFEKMALKRYEEKRKKGYRQHMPLITLDIQMNVKDPDRLSLNISPEDWEKIYSSSRGRLGIFGIYKRYRLYRKYIRNFPSLRYLYDEGFSEAIVDLDPKAKDELFVVNKSWTWHPSILYVYDFDQICSVIYRDFEVDRKEAISAKDFYHIPEISVRRGDSYTSDIFGDL